MLALAGVLATSGEALPGSPLRQGAAIAGALLLMTPFVFSIVKRSGLAASPPAWFVAHVLASALGMVLIFVHAAGGSFFTPPGLLLVLLVVLAAQGALARIYLPARLAGLFAASTPSFDTAKPCLREQIRLITKEKRALLMELDSNADEAIFSPNLHHWLRHPLFSMRYLKLASAETQLVGARRRAGPLLSFWRPLHILLAGLFVLGLIVHILFVTFFAGYVADGGPVYWWHLTAWGGQ